MSDTEGQAYMDLWHSQDPNIVRDGIPYPVTRFMSPWVFLWDIEGENACQLDPNWPDSDGIVMAWHDLPSTPDGDSVSAAWKYEASE